MNFERSCRREVEDLHLFFARWFNGEMPATSRSFERVEQVLANNFHMVTAQGVLLDREKVIVAVQRGHPGERRGLNPAPVRIWIQNYRSCFSRQDFGVVAYEEWQTQGVESRGRLCSAAMRACQETPHGIEWLHVHETWMPKQELPA